jgi:hypothetical protein
LQLEALLENRRNKMMKQAPQTIRITPDVWEALGAHAEPFETPNDVLRRLLSLPDETPPAGQGKDGFGYRRNTILATLHEILLDHPDGLTAKGYVAQLTIRCKERDIRYDGKTEKGNHFRYFLIPQGYATVSGGVYKLTEKGRQTLQGAQAVGGSAS